MFSIQSLQGQHEVFNHTYSSRTSEGLTFKCSQFGSYSPILEGSVRLVAAESQESIQVQVVARATNAAYTENIRVQQEGSEFTMETGGLSYWQSIGARMIIEVRIFLPRGSGDISISSNSLPIFVQSIEKGGDIVLSSQSSPISIANVDARSLTIISQSGSVTLESSSEQRLDSFISITTRSGMSKLSSIMLAPVFTMQGKSGSIQMNCATTATKIEVSNVSGAIQATADFMDTQNSDVKFVNSSGSMQLTTSRWSGFLTTTVKSGSTSVKGTDLEQINNGWRKGDGSSNITLTNTSGSVKVTIQ